MYIPLTFEGALQKCLFASGGYEGFFISGSQQWKYHWFTSSADLVVQKGSIDNVEITVIGGGGGGAAAQAGVGIAGGGGGGEVKYLNTARLFSGTYSVIVGKGGLGATVVNTSGLSGVTSSFIGSNISIAAGAGQGGNSGFLNRGGTSGAGLLGGLNQNNNGGGGGGAIGTGSNATAVKAGDGGNGFLLNNIIDTTILTTAYGCGGGGYTPDTGDTPGYSCNDLIYGAGGEGNTSGGNGANYFGMGGGGGFPGGVGNGGSGSVIIRYPIYDYCSNFFNETGSCGCRQVTFSVNNLQTFEFDPVETGSYLYMPCGGTQFVSGSLFAYGALTVCAVSNSYYAYSTENVNITAGFATTGRQCISASLVPVACAVEAFAPTCTSSIVTIYTPSASVGSPNTFDFVAKNATTHSTYTSTDQQVRYFCISTGSVYGENLEIYPKVLTGNFATLYNTASCNTTTFQSTAAFPANRFYSYYNCNGAKVSGQFTGPGSVTVCIDRSAPFGFTGTTSGTSTTIGGDCLSGSFNTGSCGCP